ncbi:MarC family protein [Lutibaculum baratangense]|uniref:UPF0056 membrane protein n=1 Tax=Lutibaculum baratangense AMV1 TaxID=631454 RepID=V4TAW6_9HYPH|nr:MarC family protein [Lutibaculum baratangense]ESR23568.1 Cytochrome c551 peroxidase [Lutibaculum baratangense AMV1]
MAEALVSALVTLFVVIDPIGIAPIFVSLTHGMAPAERRRVAMRSVLIAAVVLVAFAAIGQPMLEALGITLPAFRIAGGLLLFWIPTEMVFEKRQARKSGSAERSVQEDHPEDIAAFPLAVPLMAFDNVTRAIEAFEVTLITPAARFDQFLDGNEVAMNDQEKEGLRLFMDTGCVSCHNGVNLGGQDYFPFGVIERPGSDILPPEDKGRFAVTQTATDEYVFRAVPLRNVALTAPYFHSGQVWDLEQAVAIMSTAQLGIELSEEEIEAIPAFLHTLTGEQPRVEYPILPRSTDTTPVPELMVPTSR